MLILTVGKLIHGMSSLIFSIHGSKTVSVSMSYIFNLLRPISEDFPTQAFLPQAFMGKLSPRNCVYKPPICAAKQLVEET